MAYCLSLGSEKSNFLTLAQKTGLPKEFLSRSLDELANQGLIDITETNARDVPVGFKMRPLGRNAIRVVFAGGVFDIIHPGHIHTLKESRKLGDVLIVSVARNSTVVRMKGRPPLHDEKIRREMVGSIASVDLAILGSEINLFETVLRVKPEIISLGYDQEHDEGKLQLEAVRNGMKLKIIRLASPVPDLKSSKLVENRNILQET